MKSVLISIQPKWCELIASGKKTVEVRKTRPKLETPFKCYIYCTKNYSLGEFYTSKDLFADPVQGKVIGEFVCDKVVSVVYNAKLIEKFVLFNTYAIEDACLTTKEIEKYSNGKDLYGWHISNLVIYDKPKELSEFNHCGVNYHFNPPITRPPQSWCYVERSEGK